MKRLCCTIFSPIKAKELKMRYAVQDDSYIAGKMIQTAQFAVVGDAIDYHDRCDYGTREDDSAIVVEILDLKTGLLINPEMAEDQLEAVCESDMVDLYSEAA
jgi:hypothetical protein